MERTVNFLDKNAKAAKIKLLRENRRMSIEEVADYLGVPVEHYVQIEQGERFASLFIVGGLARKFQVRAADIMQDAEPFGEEIVKSFYANDNPTDADRVAVDEVHDVLNSAEDIQSMHPVR